MKSDYKLNLPKGYKRIKLPFFKKWINALESGKFEQGTGYLTTVAKLSHSYCCLGILCKVQDRLMKNGIGLLADGTDHSSTTTLSPHNPCYSELCGSGDFPDGVYVQSLGRTNTTLAECNDCALLNFTQIAEIVKKIWKA
jgi:hypothetical protein